MNSTWPKDVIDFETFLGKAGLICKCREEYAMFDNKMVQYIDDEIGVRVVLDRGIWMIEVADMATCSDEWYDCAILRDLLIGNGEDVLSLPEQIKFLETHWLTIVSCFSSTQKADTHSRLAFLIKERVKRLFPNLYGQEA